jgi:hypothetical protein
MTLMLSSVGSYVRVPWGAAGEILVERQSAGLVTPGRELTQARNRKTQASDHAYCVAIIAQHALELGLAPAEMAS